MSRLDAYFFFLNWDKIDNLKENFWDKYVDQMELSAECREWLVEVTNQKIDIENWKVALCANDAYEEIRMKLSGDVREKTDLIFSKMFGYAMCDYWEGFEEKDSGYLQMLKEADFNHCISPCEIDEILSTWGQDLIDELSKVYIKRPQNLYIPEFDEFIWHVNGWLDLMKRAKEIGNWGLILSIAY